MVYLAAYWFVPLILAFVLMGMAMYRQFENVRTFNFDNMKVVMFLALAAVFNAVLFIIGLAANLMGMKPH